MPLILQSFIKRADLTSNPNVVYLFGDNCQRTGLGGQAAEMRGEPNAVGVRTKKAPGRRPSDYFTDDEYDTNVSMIREDLELPMKYLMSGGIVVWPSSGLGTGLSDLPNRAPRTYAYLQSLYSDMLLISDKGPYDSHFKSINHLDVDSAVDSLVSAAESQGWWKLPGTTSEWKLNDPSGYSKVSDIVEDIVRSALGFPRRNS